MITEEKFLASEADTLALGSALARSVIQRTGAEGGEASTALIIYLQGELGAGKTTFTRGFMREFGYQGAVKSPTYTLVEPYELANHNIYHFDLYRLSDPEEVDYLGVDDYFLPPSISLIEWPEKGSGFLPEAAISVLLSERQLSETRGRAASIEAGNELGCRILESLDL